MVWLLFFDTKFKEGVGINFTTQLEEDLRVGIRFVALNLDDDVIKLMTTRDVIQHTLFGFFRKEVMPGRKRFYSNMTGKKGEKL